MIICPDSSADLESLKVNDVPDDDGGLEDAGHEEEEDDGQEGVDSVVAVMTIVRVDD